MNSHYTEMQTTVVLSFLFTNSVMHATKSIVMITLLMLLPYSAAQNETSLSSPPPPPSKSDGLSFNPHLKLNPSMAVILICLISAFFVMGCVSVYIRQCAEQRLMDDFANDENPGSIGRPRRAVARGLDPIIIDTFPMFLYFDVKGLKLGKGALECAVCLNEFEDDETLRLLPKCSHVFHADCIDAWLALHITCPVCRDNLVPKPEEIGHCDSLSHHLHSQSSDLVPPQEVIRSAPEINNLALENQISSQVQVIINPCQSTDNNLPVGPAPKKQRVNVKFPRSQSMGHLLVEPGEDCERFTLRLPEELRSQLMKSELMRARSCVALPRVRSSTKGFRSDSGGTGQGKSNYYERFDREVRLERWGFTVAPPFFSRGGSTRSSKNEVDGGELPVQPRNLFRSVKSPFDRLFGVSEKDNEGERSFNRLKPNEASV